MIQMGSEMLATYLNSHLHSSHILSFRLYEFPKDIPAACIRHDDERQKFRMLSN